MRVTAWVSPEGEVTYFNDKTTTHGEMAYEILTGREAIDDVKEDEDPDDLNVVAYLELLSTGWIRADANGMFEGQPEAIIKNWHVVLDIAAKAGVVETRIDLSGKDGNPVRTVNKLPLTNQPPIRMLQLIEPQFPTHIREFRRRPVRVHGHRRRV